MEKCFCSVLEDTILIVFCCGVNVMVVKNKGMNLPSRVKIADY